MLFGNHGETTVKHKRLDIFIPPLKFPQNKNEVASTQKKTCLSDMDRTSEVVGLGRGMLGCDLDFQQNMDKHMALSQNDFL